MIIDRTIINSYLEGKAVDEWPNQWIFHSIIEGQHLVETVSEDKKDSIKRKVNLLENELNKFEPYNKDIWDVLFPDWLDIVSKIRIYMVVGCPSPYDAMCRVSPDGQEVVIFDINRMVNNSTGEEVFISMAKRLLTHEFCHRCIQCNYPAPDYNTNFADKLQYICFDEGIAHFLSFKENIKDINWRDSDKLQKKESSYAVLREAINSNSGQYEYLLEKANTGAFWDKFGAISGLFAIADIFNESNYDYNSILELYREGPEEFLSDFFNKK